MSGLRRARCVAWSGSVAGTTAAALPRLLPGAKFSSHVPLSITRCRSCLNYINPGAACTFRSTAEGSHQFFQHGRKSAVGRDDGLGRRKFRHAMAGGGMARAVSEQFRHLGAAALDRIGAAGMKAAARRRIERARHFALQHNAAALCLRLGHRDGRQQRAAIGMPWRGEQRLRRPRSRRWCRDSSRRPGRRCVLRPPDRARRRYRRGAGPAGRAAN